VAITATHKIPILPLRRGRKNLKPRGKIGISCVAVIAMSSN